MSLRSKNLILALGKGLRKPLITGFLALLGLGFLGSIHPALAQQMVLQREIEVEGPKAKSDRILYNEKILFQYIDRPGLNVAVLDALTNEKESYVYTLRPHSSNFTLREIKLNLYRRENVPVVSDYQLNLKVSEQITVESRTPFVDSLVIISPFSKEIKLSLGRQFADQSSFYTFFNPVTKETISIFSKPLFSNTEVNLLAFFDPRDNKTEFLASLKFTF